MSTIRPALRSTRAEVSVPLILHVTEAMGGGLEDAIYDFIRSAPQYRHALLYTRRGSYSTHDSLPEQLVQVIDVGRGFRALNRAYRDVVETLTPDVIHLHSAWAGLIGRVHATGPKRASIVYSPHSYYFDRLDLPKPARAIAYLLERILSTRTHITAAVSPFEAENARLLGAAATYIPNVVRLPEGRRWSPSSGPAEVLLVGRIAAQKDPKFFLEVLAAAKAELPEVRWTWVGSGETEMTERLERAGVEVTGWVPRAESVARMANAAVYLHTAAWEGSPITLLEAATIGVPIVARSIPALDSLGFDPSLRTPKDVARALVELIRLGRAPLSPPAADPAAQAWSLDRAYAVVTPPRVVAPVRVEPARSIVVEQRELLPAVGEELERELIPVLVSASDSHSARRGRRSPRNDVRP